MPSERMLDDIAAAVLDGQAVDWIAAESRVASDAQPIVQHLRLVASIAELLRDVSSTDMRSGVPAPGPETTAPVSWSHLRILERIGQGAFGEVFRAWDTRLDREVALKLLPAGATSDGQTSSIIREGKLLARVRHSNVVTIYGAEQVGDQIGLWMEFVRGQTLEQTLQRGTVFRPADVIGIGAELARAVSAVHAAGLLHRDIKAHNVTRAEDGRVVLMDFGTGKELDDHSSSDLAGTPLCLAPEVMAGQPATVQSDIYSLGVLLYHLVTGSYPVRGGSVRDVRRAHQSNARVGLRQERRDVPRGLARVIERAIDPQLARRYPSAEALAHDLIRLQRRPAVVRGSYALGVAAAVILVAVLASEVLARITPEHQSLRSRLAGFVAGAPAPVDDPVIVVLPFRNLSAEPDTDRLVDSLTAGLIQQLGIINGLRVRFQQSSFMLPNKSRDLAAFGKQLGANLAVEGTVQLSGGKLVIDASLLPIAGGDLLWTATLTREIKSAGDLTDVLTEIVRTIVNKLRLTLGPTQRRYATDIVTYEKVLESA